MKMLSKVEVERMYQLAHLLETVSSQDFDLTIWGTRVRDDCGFAGCAIGWAAYAKLFPGLVMMGDGVRYFDKDKGIGVGYHAAVCVLGITSRTANFLFCPHYYEIPASPAVVAARLTRFAAIVERRLARAVQARMPQAVSFTRPLAYSSTIWGRWSRRFEKVGRSFSARASPRRRWTNC